MDSRAPDPDSCWTREARGVPPTDEVGKWRGEEDRAGFGEDMLLRMVWGVGRKGEKEKGEGKIWNPGKQKRVRNRVWTTTTRL